MTLKKRLLYIHGGPGLNSNPERELLGKAFHDASFDFIAFDAPSAFREKSAGNESPSWACDFPMLRDALETFLDQNCAQYEGQVVILAHSFAIHPLASLIPKYKEKISLLILTAPCISLLRLDSNIAAAAIQDFSLSNPSKAQELKTLLNQMESESEQWSPLKQELLSLAFEDEGLFYHYWSDSQLMEKYFSFFTGNYQIDFESFWETRKTTGPFSLGPESEEIKTLIIFGEEDPIVRFHEEKSTCEEYFPKAQIIQMAGVRHYPQIEKTQKFIALMLQFLSGKQKDLGPKFVPSDPQQ